MGLGSTILEDSNEEISFRAESEEEVWVGPEALFAWFVNMLLLNDEQFIYINFRNSEKTLSSRACAYQIERSDFC